MHNMHNRLLQYVPVFSNGNIKKPATCLMEAVDLFFSTKWCHSSSSRSFRWLFLLLSQIWQRYTWISPTQQGL